MATMADRRLAAALALLLGACTTSSLRYEEVLAGLDGVLVVEPPEAGKPARLRYRDEGPVAPWPLRFVLFVPLQPLLRLFVGEPDIAVLDNPPGHARDLIETLGSKAAGDLLSSAEAATRLLPIAELDGSNLDRMVAIDALARICRSLALPLLPDLLRQEQYPERDPPWWSDALDALRQLRPLARGDRPLDDVAGERYRAALAQLTRRPLATAELRLKLISDLALAFATEQQPELQGPTAAALRLALQHGVDWLLLDLLAGREPELQPTRLLVLDLLHTAGGSDAVPVLLAWLAAPGAAVDRFEGGLMRLRLIQLCGQLDAARGAVAAQLPGREAWEALSPLQFLCDQILPPVGSDDDLDPFGNPMRVPAQEALCYVLQRPIDYELQWVREWNQEFRQGR